MVRLLAFLIALGLPFAPARAVAQEAPLPVAAAVVDRDGDTVPDRIGERLTVAGRASVGSGVLRSDELDLFLRSADGGLRLRRADWAAPVAAGDSVIATGVLTHDAGLAVLTDVVYRVVSGQQVEPPVLPLRASTSREALEGAVVRVKAQITGRGHVGEGTYLNLLVGDSLLVAFLYNSHGGDASFGRLTIGRHVVVTGILGQYDNVAPYNAGYQIYPRTAEDIRAAGLPPSFYPRAITAGLGLLAMALLWIFALRRQVRRRLGELRAKELRYQVLFQNAGDAVFLHDLGPAGPRLIEINDVACRLLGYQRDEVLNQRGGQFVVGDEATVRGHFEALAEDAETLNEVVLKTRDGTHLPVEVRSHRFELEGRPVVLSIARDATARRAYEDGLIRARQEAEALARAKTAFLANMSHEIRTPLAAITGFSEILREELDGPYGHFAGLIDDAARRLLGTLNSILHLARMSASEVVPQPTMFDAAASVRSSMALLEPLAQRKALRLAVVTEPDILPVQLDVRYLDRILNNLVGNAIKFTDEGAVTVHLANAGDAIVLRVQDTGCGIDPAFMPHLFEEFKQETAGHARRHEGSGLGLAITKRLVALMGGTIEVESEKGRGTTFTVRLPRLLSTTGDPAPGVVEAPVGG